MTYPISTIEIAYQSIVDSTDSNPILVSTEDVDDDVAPVWKIDSTLVMDFLDIVLPYEEEILESMIGVEILWDDLHYRSYFLPNLCKVE